MCLVGIVFNHLCGCFGELLTCLVEGVLAIVEKLFNGCIFAMDIGNGEVEWQVDVTLVNDIIW